MVIEGVWGPTHIAFFVSCVLAITIGLILIKKFARSDKTYNLILLITGICLLILIIINRVSSVYESLVLKWSGYYYPSWWGVIPETLCGATSLYLSVTLILIRKDHNRTPYHFLVYMAIISAFPACIYPGFLDNFPAHGCSSITSLLHHFVQVWAVLVIIISGQFKPTIKKWHIFLLNYVAYIVIGLFEKTVFGCENPFNIDYGLLKSLPHLTSWYLMLIASTLAVIIFLVLYEHFKNKKTFKLVFQQMLFLK